MSNRHPFIRFEDKDGKGLYQIIRPWDFQELHEPKRHPIFFYDEELVNNFREKYNSIDYQDFIFGFSSWEQVKKWFDIPGILSRLEKSGIVCSIYDGEITNGGRQALIRKETAIFCRHLTMQTVKKYFKIK